MKRRDFVRNGVFGGLALAVAPGTLFAVETSAAGLVTEEVSIPLGGRLNTTGYLAMPKGQGPFPAVLVVHEIFGVHSYIQDICRRLAKQGYAAVAPYLYTREGDVSNIPDIDKVIADVVSKVPQDQVWNDLDKTREWLAKRKEVDVTKVGITGFCWGGAVVWTYCAKRPELKAGVAWYGKLAVTHTPGAKSPLDLVSELRVPVLGFYGSKDKGIPVDDVKKMQTALKAGKKKSEIILYPDVEHGFHADYRPSYHEKTAKEAWGKMLTWFKKSGL